MLQTHDLNYRQGRAFSLSQINLRFEPGQLSVIGGPNGSGKSTLLRLLAGEKPPRNGRVSLDGQDLRQSSARQLARRRAVLPQTVPRQLSARVEEVVALGRSPFPNESLALTQLAIANALDLVGLADHATQPYDALSGGEQARVQFARSLAQLHTATNGAAYLLDEPTANLDPYWQHQCMRILRQCCERGLAVVCVLHDLNLASRYADRLVILQRGQMCLDGDAQSVLADPQLDQIYQLGFSRVLLAGKHYLHAADVSLGADE